MCAFSKTIAKKEKEMERKESSVVEVMAWGIFCPPSGQFVNVQDLMDIIAMLMNEPMVEGGRDLVEPVIQLLVRC